MSRATAVMLRARMASSERLQPRCRACARSSIRKPRVAAEAAPAGHASAGEMHARESTHSKRRLLKSSARSGPMPEGAADGGVRVRAAIGGDRKKGTIMDGRSGLERRKRGNEPGVVTRRRSRAIAPASGAPYEVRTRVPALRGRCPRPLDEGSVLGNAELRSITNR